MIKNNIQFWNKIAPVYHIFIGYTKKAKIAYETMENDICKYLNRKMNVLELAAGTGEISRYIASSCRHLEATDFSEDMIRTAKKKEHSLRLHFSVQDATRLTYKEGTFDAVVIANALHIMPDPVLALDNINRVLKKGGIMICPTFSRERGKHGFKERAMELIGFRTYNRWSHLQFIRFIKSHGFKIIKSYQIFGHEFPISFVVAMK